MKNRCCFFDTTVLIKKCGGDYDKSIENQLLLSAICTQTDKAEDKSLILSLETVFCNNQLCHMKFNKFHMTSYNKNTKVSYGNLIINNSFI